MLHSSLAWLIHLRSTQPGLFCLLITGLLMMTAIVGKIIPGVIIAYIAGKHENSVSFCCANLVMQMFTTTACCGL